MVINVEEVFKSQNEYEIKKAVTEIFVDLINENVALIFAS